MGISDTFSRSWEITKHSFGVIRSDKEIILFPILASFFSVVFFVMMAVPFMMSGVMEAIGFDRFGSISYMIVLFMFYLGMSFISTFFNVCVAYCAKKRFEGGDPTFTEGLREAAARIHLIFLWSLLSATVGLILRIIENSARESRNDLARILLSALTSILGAAWSIASLFVVPAMVIDNVGPFEALSNSVKTLKKTWGESLVRHYGLGFAQAVVMIAGAIVLLLPGILLIFSAAWAVGLALIGIFVFYLAIVAVLFGTAGTIFNTALYLYAMKGKVVGYSPETIKNAFVHN